LHTSETEHGKFGLVLVLILSTLTFQLAFPERGWARLLVVTLQGVTLIAALVASRIGKLHVRIVALGVATLVIVSLAILLGSGELSPTPARLLGVLLAAIAPVAIISGVLRHMRADGAVTVQTMFGVLCVYLLIGLLFSSGFGLIEALNNTPFFAHNGDSSDFLYFSFATITTVGYGDLTAATDLGRSLAITEALIGQIYLVTVVALIVANIGNARKR
jgi:hypothetical protein